jgi:citrate synthase
MDAEERWIGRREALERLGIKTQTLYAYVSRGRITARPDPSDPRRSLYASEDIERLVRGDAAPSGGLRQAPSRGEAEVLSGLSTVVDGRLFYRGLDAVQLSQQATLEEVARRLWALREGNPFAGLRPRVDLFTGGSIRSRIYATLARRAGEDPPATARPIEELALDAATALNEAIDAAAGPGPRLHFHQRLARGWKLIERDAHVLRRALVLCADGPLDHAVMATRTTAGGGAPVAGAALAGLTTLAASPLVRRTQAAVVFVIEARRDPAAKVRARSGEPDLFGPDEDWPQGDPRGAALLAGLTLPPDLAAVQREVEAATGRPVDLAFALALTARALDLPREGATDLILAGRLAGLLGHALDQRRSGSPIRARLRYVGPEPGAN